MSNYANTKATIDANVYTNGNNEVTAAMVNAAIDAVVDTIIAGGFLYKGIAHPADAAVTPDANCFWIATEAGTYTNKNGYVLDGTEAVIIKYNGSWSKEDTGIKLVSVSQNTLLIGGVPVGSEWVIGAGTNLVKNWNEGYQLRRSDGFAYPVGTSDFHVSDFIAVTPGEKYLYVGKISGSTWARLCGYSSNTEASFVQSWWEAKYGSDVSVNIATIPAGVNYVRVSFYGAGYEDGGLWKYNSGGMLAQLQDIAESQFSAIGIEARLPIVMYSNLALLFATGKTAAVTGNFYVSGFIPVIPGRKYVYRASKPSKSFLAIAGYSTADENDFVDTFRVVKAANNSDLDIVKIPSGVNYVRLSYVGTAPEVAGIWPLKDDGLLLYYYEKLEAEKADKVISRNIIDPANGQYNAYLASNGVVVAITSPENFVTDFIPVEEGEKIVVPVPASGSNAILTIAAYDEVGNFLRGVSGGETHYTQQGKEKFIRIGTVAPRVGYPMPFANRGADAAEYDNYATAASWYQGTSKPALPTPSVPDYIYTICDDVQQYSLAMYPDHLVDLRTPNLQPVTAKLIFKETGRDHLDLFAPISPDLSTYNGGEDKLEQAMAGTIIGDYKDVGISFILRSIWNAYTKDNPIRVLCIGDSVTAGTGSYFPRSLTSGNPKQYWHWMHRFCLDDQHNHSSSAYKYLSIGTRNENDFEYRGNSYRDFAEGRGGWNIANYLFDASYDTMDNAFYDGSKVWTGDDAAELNTAGVKFSLSKYLARFKTLQDDGETRLVVGSTAGTDVTDVMAYDVCTPNVIVIQLGHNNSAADYADNMPLLIKAIRNEFPAMKIILSVADETGAYNVNLYPEFPTSQLLYAYLHGEFVKQIEICKTLEGQFSDLLFCPSGVIQPTAWSTAYKEMPKAASLAGKDFPFEMKIGAGANYHPSAIAHAAWAYQMLACIKWILS